MHHMNYILVTSVLRLGQWCLLDDHWILVVSESRLLRCHWVLLHGRRLLEGNIMVSWVIVKLISLLCPHRGALIYLGRML